MAGSLAWLLGVAGMATGLYQWWFEADLIQRSGELTDLDVTWLKRKLALYGFDVPKGVENMKKIVAGKKLWNYDNPEPTEKKLIL